MKQLHENNFEMLREQTRKISELSQQLEQMRNETLAALIKDDAFNKARDLAFENIKVSPNVVQEEIRFMRQVINLFSDGFLSDEAKRDKMYSKVILNEHRYFEYWLEHPELEEVAINADAMKLLVTKTYDLDLPTRIMNCFRVLDIDYMFELVDKKPKDFLVYRNMGEKSMKQLTDYVESLGFCFDYKIRFSEKDKLYYTLK